MFYQNDTFFEVRMEFNFFVKNKYYFTFLIFTKKYTGIN